MSEGHTELVATIHSTRSQRLNSDKLLRMLLVNRNILELAHYTQFKLTPPPILQGNGLNHLDPRQAGLKNFLLL